MTIISRQCHSTIKAVHCEPPCEVVEDSPLRLNQPIQPIHPWRSRQQELLKVQG